MCDVAAKPAGVSSEAEIHVHQLRPGCAYLAVASDGLWEFMENEDVGEVIYGVEQGTISLEVDEPPQPDADPTITVRRPITCRYIVADIEEWGIQGHIQDSWSQAAPRSLVASVTAVPMSPTPSTAASPNY